MRENGESIKGCGPGPIGDQEWGVTTAPVGGGKTFYLHIFKSPGAIIEIPVAKKDRIRSISALAKGSSLNYKKVGEKLFITLPTDLPEDSDFVIAVTKK